jgi:hypothetical protein
MDCNHHVVFGDRWHIVCFLTVREIFPHEVGSPKQWSRSPLDGYMSLMKGKVVVTRKLKNP